MKSASNHDFDDPGNHHNNTHQAKKIPIGDTYVTAGEAATLANPVGSVPLSYR